MEVGAVKQAFNNEVILLKNKLNQAKIQTIHKLTRKAKTLTEKKVPDKLKEKFNKKAESAVKEVLIIKKIKPRDIAKFIVTHKGQLNEYLNKPTVDQDKACARLLLHKALQDKYKIIRERFSNISIEDLLMSRLERRKLKKEAREKQKNKKTKKVDGQVHTDDNWDVEDVNMDDTKDNNPSDSDLASSDDEEIDDRMENDNERISDENNSINCESIDDVELEPKVEISKNKTKSFADVSKAEESSECDDEDNPNGDSNESDEDEIDNSVAAIAKVTPKLSNINNCRNKDANIKVSPKLSDNRVAKTNENDSKKKLKEKHKENNKNKNLKNKILMKKFNKEKTETPVQENKVVDPFFITATGENYMSVAETRQPDEVKEEHREGNRKYRRAVMFGHVPKAKFRNDFRSHNDTRFNKFNNNKDFSNDTSNFKNHGNHEKFQKSDRSSNRENFKDRKSFGSRNMEEDAKPEKLHPSWEAKKRQSGILPFQGKKIVFDES